MRIFSRAALQVLGFIDCNFMAVNDTLVREEPSTRDLLKLMVLWRSRVSNNMLGVYKSLTKDPEGHGARESHHYTVGPSEQ